MIVTNLFELVLKAKQFGSNVFHNNSRIANVVDLIAANLQS